jgi:hypothetical protein
MAQNDHRPRVGPETWNAVEQIVEEVGDRRPAVMSERDKIDVVVRFAERALQAKKAQQREKQQQRRQAGGGGRSVRVNFDY